LLHGSAQVIIHRLLKYNGSLVLECFIIMIVTDLPYIKVRFCLYTDFLDRKQRSDLTIFDSCSACGHHLQDLTSFWIVPHLSLFGVSSLALLLPFLTSGPGLGAWPDCGASVEFLRAPISWKGSGNTTTTTIFDSSYPSITYRWRHSVKKWLVNGHVQRNLPKYLFSHCPFISERNVGKMWILIVEFQKGLGNASITRMKGIWQGMAQLWESNQSLSTVNSNHCARSYNYYASAPDSCKHYA